MFIWRDAELLGASIAEYYSMVMVSIIAAMGKNRAIGKNNRLLWHIPEDLKRFKRLTQGHPVIMGRKTFESILASLGKPLPGRTNIVVTHNAAWNYPGVISAPSIEEALARATELNSGEIFIIGGAQIYEQALPFADKLYLTLIDDEKDGDSFFPPYENNFKIIHEENGGREPSHHFLILVRK